MSNQKLATLEKLAKAFGCSIGELVDDRIYPEDDKNNNQNFDQKLFNKASKNVEKYLKNKEINFNKQKTIKLIYKLYSLMIKNKKISTSIDENIIEWVIDNTILT